MCVMHASWVTEGPRQRFDYATLTRMPQVDGHVGYYDGSGPSKELKGEFTLTSDCEVLPSSKRPHCFALKGEGLKKKGGMFTVAGADEADKERWIQAFENHVRFVRDREAMDMDRVDYDFPA
jgi:hypothetical protein